LHQNKRLIVTVHIIFHIERSLEMKKHNLRWISVLLLMVFILTSNNSVFAKEQTDKLNFQDLTGKTKNEIEKVYKSKKSNANIILIDNEGKVTNEYHSDGAYVEYRYNADGELDIIEDSDGIIVRFEKLDNGKVKVKTTRDNEVLKEQYVGELASISTESLTTANTSTQLSGLAVASDTIINGYNLSNILSDSEFTNKNSMTKAEIQTFLENMNSVFANDIQIYRENANGVYNASDQTRLPDLINLYCGFYNINPKVVITHIQKESSLIKNSTGTPHSSKSIIWCMGYGATDSGKIWECSGLDKQISGGVKLMRDTYDSAPSSYPQTKLVNYGTEYVKINNKATYVLYVYTPHTYDITLLPTIGGGNYLFMAIADGYFDLDWN